MMFADDEALALSVGLLAARPVGLAQAAPAVERAQAKLERVLPDALKAQLRALSKTISLDLSRSANAANDNSTLLTLSLAAHSLQRVHLRYRSPHGEGCTESERDFDAYGLAWRGGRWYAVGHCHLRKELRSFRLDRVVEINKLNLHFSPPTKFDAFAYLAKSAATMPPAICVVVLLETDLNTARNELFDSIGVFQPTDAGVLLTSQFDDLNWYARQLPRLPFSFVVKAPTTLRKALILRAKQLIDMAKK